MWPFKYPYTNFHELNLDWVLEEIKKINQELAGVPGEIQKAISDLVIAANLPFTTPQMFGAVADGVTDDTAAINAAIDARPSTGFVFFPVGVYKVSNSGTQHKDSAVIIPSNTSLIGAGNGTARIKAAEEGVHILVVVPNSENITISGIDVDGSANEYTAGTHGLRFQGVQRATVSGCNFWNCPHYCIAFALNGSAVDVDINNCTFNGSGGDSIDFKNSYSLNRGIRITGNTFRRWGLKTTSTYQCAIDIRGRATVSGNTISDMIGSACGIRMRESNELQGEGGYLSSIVGNVIESDQAGGGSGTGIILNDNITCGNNVISGMSVGIQAANGNAISGNTIKGVGDGIRVTGTSNVISGNNISECINNPVRISADKNIVTGNRIEGRRSVFFNVDGTKNQIITSNIASIGTQGAFTGVVKNNIGIADV